MDWYMESGIVPAMKKRTGKYRKYPQMNSGNSAHVVFQDSHKNIWVGTWGAGLHLLHDAYKSGENHLDNIQPMMKIGRVQFPII